MVIERVMVQKKLLIYLLIVVIVFTTFCIEDEKKSQAPDPLIELSDFPNGYYYSEYTTGAIPKDESFKISPNFLQSFSYTDIHKYYGDIPLESKRIMTKYILDNDNNSINMIVYIYEFDLDSGFEEYFSSMESSYGYFGEDCSITTNLIGSNSILVVLVPEYYVLQFNNENYLIIIFGDSAEEYNIKNNVIPEEMLKVAKAIEIKLDDS
jgi:hypothetical protein